MTIKEIKENIKKTYNKYREIISYLFFGVLTTAVNYAVLGIFLRVFGVSGENKNDLLVVVANTIAWVAAVTFAFITNKLLVFRSKSKEKKTIARELTSFVAARLATYGVETGILYLGLRIHEWADMRLDYDVWTWAIKVFTSIIVIVLNYVFSKFIIFKKEDRKT